MKLPVAALLAMAAVPALAEQVSLTRPATLPASSWRDASLPASSFAPRAQPSSLAPAGGASAFRLGEVRNQVRERTQALLGSFGATQEGQEIRLSLPGDVLFDFDRSDIRADARPVLNRMAELLRNYPRAPVDIQGHTDWMGDDAYNQALSDRRAWSVQAYLARQGVSAARLRPEGFGEARPVAPNARPDGADDPEGRQRNRRVEFVIRPAP